MLVVLIHVRAVLLVVLLISMLLGVQPTTAQAAEGTLHLGSTILSDPASSSAGCRTVKHYPMDAVAANIPDGKAYWDEISGGLGCAIWFDFVMPASATLSGTGKLTFTYGCDAFTSASSGNDFRVRLYKNGEQASQQDFNVADTCTSAGGAADLAIATGDTSFAAGDTLSLGVVSWFVNTPSAQLKNLHIKVGPSNPATFTAAGLGALFSLPAPEAPAIKFVNVTTPELSIRHEDAQNVTLSEVYNWTADGTYTLTAMSNGTGNISFRLDGADNQTLAQGNLTGTSDLMQDLAATGNVTLHVMYTSFSGTFKLDIAAKTASGTVGQTSSAPGNGSAGEPSDDGTTGQQEDDGDEAASTPPTAFGLVVVALAVLVALRRREA